VSKQTSEKPDYGNWVSKRLIYFPGALALIFTALSFWSQLFIIFPVIFLIIMVYFSYAYYRFSPAGGDIQSQIREFVLNKLVWDGKGSALDIGCGNGALVTRLAKKYPQASVIGIDYWAGKWEYSQKACERNAEIEGVAGRTTFRKASAVALPFQEEMFDAAISNFVFHEVEDARDKREVIREALRVIKKGGVFAFQDLFPVRRLFGGIDDLLATVKGWGVQEVSFINTSNADFIPAALKLPFMVGSIGIIYGKK
jgi:ubiquinone/menaquinone biosynthesis C-methylase UbiE